MVMQRFRFTFPLTDSIKKYRDKKGKWCIEYQCDVCLCPGDHHTRVFNTEKEADDFYAEAIVSSFPSIVAYYEGETR